MRRALVIAATPALFLVTMASTATAAETIMKFTTMVGVDGAFVGHNPIRGVLGDELPWEIGSVKGSLMTDGHLQVNITGLVFANDPSVPVNLRGIMNTFDDTSDQPINIQGWRPRPVKPVCLVAPPSPPMHIALCELMNEPTAVCPVEGVD